MIVSLTTIMCCFIFLFIVGLVYFGKKRIRSFENEVYSILLVITFFGLIIEMLCFVFVIHSSESQILSIFNIVINKTFIVYLLLWELMFTLYIFVISNSITNFSKKEKIKVMIIYFVLALINISLHLDYYYDGLYVYSFGKSTTMLEVIGGICIFLDLFFVLKNINKISKKKIIPLFVLILLMIFVVILRNVNPGLTIINSCFALVTIIMYFTIENPDVKMIEQLEIAKEAADKANNAKTDFLSSMSHEIRTPLNAIVGFSDCIKESTTLEEAKENADDIISASNTLLEIVNGILDISKIEAGKLEIVNSNYDPKELFNSLAKLVTPKMNEKALDFHVSIAEDLPNCLYGDHANVKKVVTNILSNAYKYTDSGFVRYEVNCVNKNDVCRLVISVEDSGRGIKSEDVNKLFTKFQRVDEDRNTTIEGTGLGLAITKQLVELMGGNIIVHTIYGEGSKFTITLDQKISNVELNQDEEVDTIDLTGKTILVVDDNPLNLKVATKLLNSYNAEVVTSESGFDCISKIQEGNTYDLILLDDMMPKMRGTETFKKLKEDSNFKIPVIALTANAITGMREKYLKDGFDDYLAKPIEKEAMIRAFSKIFSNSVTKKTKNDEIYNNRDFLEANDIDVSHGIELLGDMNMYNDTMIEFIKEMDKRLPKLEKYKKDSDMENYAILVHAIKSDCKYLGIMSLADLTYEHELKSKDNDIEYINKNYDKLVEKIEDYVIICKKYLGID